MYNYSLNKHMGTKIKIGNKRHNYFCFVITKISYLMLRIHHDLLQSFRYDTCDTEFLGCLFVHWSRNRAKGTIPRKKNQGNVDNASLPPDFIGLGFVILFLLVLKKNFVKNLDFYNFLLVNHQIEKITMHFPSKQLRNYRTQDNLIVYSVKF